MENYDGPLDPPIGMELCPQCEGEMSQDCPECEGTSEVTVARYAELLYERMEARREGYSG